MRRIYLDNIRWTTVLLVMIYHIFYIFNSAGVPGGVGPFSETQYQDTILYFVYPWFMVLLFVVAGMSARYSLEKRSAKEFIKSRTTKLLVPSTLGLFAFQFIVGYFNIKIGGGLEQMPSFMLYPVSAISGIGPLWFAQMLWLFSLVIVLLKKIDKKDSLIKLCRKCNIVIVILLFIVIWGASQIFNMPVLTMYRFGIYFVSFLIGYYVLSNDEIQYKIEKVHLPLLTVAIAMGIAYTYYYFGKDYTSTAVLRHIFTNAYAWVMVLAILATFKAKFNNESKLTRYMSRSGFGFYVLHYMPTLLACYYLKQTHLPTVFIYIFALVIVFIATPVLYEIIRRIPIYRYLVLGIRREKNVKG